MNKPREFSSLEISQMTGATKRQLQWWDERNMIRPMHAIGGIGGTGNPRLYSPLQALQIYVIIELKSRGVTLPRALDVALRAKLEPRFGQCHYMLVPDDDGAPVVVDKNSIVSTISESSRAWFLVDLKPYIKAVTA